MDARALREFLEQVKAGEIAVEDAVRRLGELPIQQIAEFAQLDGERALRMGVPEVIYGERKRPEQIGALIARLVLLGQAVLVTRMAPEAEAAALAAAPAGRYDPISRTFSAPPPAGWMVMIAYGSGRVLGTPGRTTGVVGPSMATPRMPDICTGGGCSDSGSSLRRALKFASSATGVKCGEARVTNHSP